MVGQPLRVVLQSYHVALWRGGVRKLAFWEVARVDGLPEMLHYAPQREVYHVTDTAALVGCAPRDARDILNEMHRGTLHADWSVVTMSPDDERCPENTLLAIVSNV